jgi:disulfide bond formation protein DsbB
MIEKILWLNSLVAVGVLLMEIFLAVFIVWFAVSQESFLDFVKKFTVWRNVFADNWSQMLLIKIFALTFISFAMSLTYSDYLGVVPCSLCWFGRIFMYGIMVLSGVALYRREAMSIFPYINIFAILGLAISLYHHFLQITASASSYLPCPASGGDCAKRIIFEYGHITFPWTAVVVFSSIIFIAMIEKKLRTN